MKPVLNGAQMRDADRHAIDAIGMPAMVLMERAALACCAVIQKLFSRDSKILILCGSGNNGGDGFAIGRLLRFEGYRAEVFFAGKRDHMSEECRKQEAIFRSLGMQEIEEAQPDRYDLIVDAIFGNGLSRPVSGTYAELIEQVNRSKAKVLAVDLPSGVRSDDGKVEGAVVHADYTVAIEALKYGHVLYPAAELCGEITLAHVGIPIDSEAYSTFTLEETDLSGLLPVRPRRSNKGTFGRCLIAAGAENMAGAAILAGTAAYRSGCGLVELRSSSANRIILQTSLPEAIYAPWTDPQSLRTACEHAAVVAIGPGLGTNVESRAVLEAVLTSCTQERIPLVLDADALNLMAVRKEMPVFVPRTAVITPHPGEAARLLGCSVKEILDDMIESAKKLAERTGAYVVLKDAATVVTDGHRICVNTSGCSGMASGGSGDVLTGLIAGLAAQGMDLFDAACAGVCLHGKAGEAAQAIHGERGMLAGDTCAQIAHVLHSVDLVSDGPEP